LRADRLSHFKERLRHGSDNFEFSALIDGVSTLDEPAPTESPVAPFVAGLAPAVEERGAAPRALLQEPVSPGLQEIRETLPTVSTDSRTSPTLAEGIQTILDIPAAATGDLEYGVIKPDSLLAAISELSSRLALQASALREALSAKDVRASGERLARLNHSLELLRSVDPRGDQARRFGIPGAPPLGRSWPTTTWSVYEFAESPLSGLLPPDADQEFVHSVLYASWGVSFE
jgi:hypothetical protein